jgi:adsorption protein B
LLLERGLISKKQLEMAIVEQQRSGERLGHVLARLNLVSEVQLIQVLSDQYHLPLTPRSALSEIKIDATELPKRLLRWIKEQNALVVAIDKKNWLLSIAIEDPTNELLLERIMNHILPFKAKFLLIDPTR